MRILAFLFAGALLYAQLEPNTITVTAARSVALQPDQVIFMVSVVTPAATSLEDVTAALQGSGITAAQFAGLASPSAFIITGEPTLVAPMLQWIFALPVPTAKFKETAASLDNVQSSIVAKNNGIAMSYNVNGVQSSQQARVSSLCPVTDLIADARTQALRLSVASGLTLGPIVALSSTNSQEASGNAIALIAVRTGDFSFPGNIIPVSRVTGSYASFLLGGVYYPSYPSPPLTCYLTVKFSATRY